MSLKVARFPVNFSFFCERSLRLNHFSSASTFEISCELIPKVIEALVMSSFVKLCVVFRVFSFG